MEEGHGEGERKKERKTERTQNLKLRTLLHKD